MTQDFANRYPNLAKAFAEQAAVYAQMSEDVPAEIRDLQTRLTALIDAHAPASADKGAMMTAAVLALCPMEIPMGAGDGEGDTDYGYQNYIFYIQDYGAAVNDLMRDMISMQRHPFAEPYGPFTQVAALCDIAIMQMSAESLDGALDTSRARLAQKIRKDLTLHARHEKGILAVVSKDAPAIAALYRETKAQLTAALDAALPPAAGQKPASPKAF
jgi:hypothetical protein